MNKTIKRIVCVVTMGMILSTVGYNFVSAESSTTISSGTPSGQSQEEENESDLISAIDDEINNSKSIVRNLGSKIKFTIDNKWDNYKIYLDDKLLEERKDTNTFYWEANELGTYEIKLVGENSKDGTSQIRKIVVKVVEKDAQAPQIKNINIYNSLDKNMECAVDARGENIKYKYQVKMYQVPIDGGKDIRPIYSYKDISGFIENNNIEWNQIKCFPEEGMVNGYTIKVIAQNEYGYDCKEYNFSPEPANNMDVADLKTAINEEIIEGDSLQFNTNDSLEFKGERGYINYELYVNGKLIDKDFRRNYLDWKPDKAGEYEVRVVGYDNENGKVYRAEKKINITIANKHDKAPTIKNISLSSTEKDNKRQINCLVNADGENNQYKVETLTVAKSNLPTGYWADEFTPYKVIKEFSNENSADWNEDVIKENNQESKYHEEGEIEYFKSVKITVKNEYGYDSIILNYNKDFEYNNTIEVEKDLDVSVDEEILKDDSQITKNVDSNIRIMGEKGYIYYDLYVDDKLVDSVYRKNRLEWKADEVGEHNVKVVAYDEKDDTNKVSKTFKVNVIKKDEKVPKIKEVKLNSKTTYDNKRDINCDISASGENNKYKFEILSKDKVITDTGYWAEDFDEYELINDFSENNIANWQDTILDVGKYKTISKDNMTEYIRKVKITVKNEYGYDSVVLDYNDDLNLKLYDDEDKGTTTPKGDEDKGTDTPKENDNKGTDTPNGEYKGTSTPNNEGDNSVDDLNGENNKTTQTPNNEDKIEQNDSNKGKDDKEPNSHTGDVSSIARFVGISILGLSQALLLKKRKNNK